LVRSAGDERKEIDMYGTVARMQVKPGAEEQFAALAQEFEGLSIPGHIGTYVYRLDDEPNVLWLAVAFQDKAAYRRNAESPEQDARYQQMRALLIADPEWHDGEIIFPQS
jgi:quinol monooxygenase YgiN